MCCLKEFPLIHIFLCIQFIVFGLIINLIQLILFLVLSQINKSLYRRINYYLVYSIYSQLVFLVDWWAPCQLKVYCQPEVLEDFGKKNAVIIMNHHYELDWLFGFMMGDREAILGNCRVYAKKMLQYVPIIGWAWRLSDIVFLERNWEKDKLNLASRLNELLNYPSSVWLLLFPEGTRFSPEKHAVSRKFAASRNLPDLKHHLIPRTKGFSFTMSELDPERMCYLYDVTLVAGGEGVAPPNLTSAICGRSTRAAMYIRRYKFSDIPKDEKESGEWLMNLFQEKDELKESFLETGCFKPLSAATKANAPKCEQVEIQRRVYSLIVTIVLQCCVQIPIIGLVVYGSCITRMVIGLILLLSWIAMHWFLKLTKISDSSSYGGKSTQQVTTKDATPADTSTHTKKDM